MERWRASAPVEAGAGTVAPPQSAPAPHLNDGATIKHSGVRRLRRRHRERFGAMLGEGYWQSDAVLITLTMDEETAANPARAVLWNSCLTATGARLRRMGVEARVTASERGRRTGRQHRHIAAGVGIQDMWTYALKHWRGFREFARNWDPDEGAVKAMVLQHRWENRGKRGKRPYAARTYQELVLGRYLGMGALGWVDVHDVTGKRAVGYMIKYTSKGGGRVSYSRPASRPWANGAKLLVYAYDGQMVRYPRRRAEWVKNEIGRCERREARRRHDLEASRSNVVGAMLTAMARHEDYLTMTAANGLHFQASNLHAQRAAAIRYRWEERENPDMEREAIRSADED